MLKPIPLPGFEHYSISDTGEITNPDGLVLKCRKNNWGYVLVNLRGKGRRITTRTVHRLVMLAFRGPCPEGLQVNHIDGNKANNCLSNLEYVTQSQNIAHAVSTGLYPWGPR